MLIFMFYNLILLLLKKVYVLILKKHISHNV